VPVRIAYAVATVRTVSSVNRQSGSKSVKAVDFVRACSWTDPIISPAIAPIMSTSPRVLASDIQYHHRSQNGLDRMERSYPNPPDAFRCGEERQASPISRDAGVRRVWTTEKRRPLRCAEGKTDDPEADRLLLHVLLDEQQRAAACEQQSCCDDTRKHPPADAAPAPSRRSRDR